MSAESDFALDITEDEYREDIETLAQTVLELCEEHDDYTIEEAANDVVPESETRHELNSLAGVTRLLFGWTRVETVNVGYLREVDAATKPDVALDALAEAIVCDEIIRVAKTWENLGRDRNAWAHSC